jgi:hypothetical protein
MSKTDTPLEFMGTSREDLSEFPDEVKYCIGRFEPLRKAANTPTPNR